MNVCMPAEASMLVTCQVLFKDTSVSCTAAIGDAVPYMTRSGRDQVENVTEEAISSRI